MEFGLKWYLVKRQAVDEALLGSLRSHVLARFHGNLIARGDKQVPGAPAAYGDPRMNALLEDMRDTVESATGHELWPTFSYLRVYERGNLLKAHHDRPACEVSMTINLGISPDEAWPLWIAGPAGVAAIALNPGDALIYRGCDCYHWREPFAGDYAAQVSLHYVDRHGPSAAWKFDRRVGLA